MEHFSISVIIPVFNAEAFIEKAIKSALQQPEVTEVIVVNDGCTDGSLQIIEFLKEQDARVKIYHHKNYENKGRSASRNLGIKNTSTNYIAFLDADDFYLENRFENDIKLFKANKNIDGVYNAIGAQFYRKATVEEQKRLELCTVKERIDPDELFEVLLKGNKGYFSIDGLTVKGSVFDSVGLFNENLMVSEDTELIWRMALKCQLESGIINKAVAIRGVHLNNVFNQENLYRVNRTKMFETLIFWSSKNNISKNKIDLLLKWLWILKFKEEKNLTKNILYWAYLFVNSPNLLTSKLCIKYFPLVRQRKDLFPFLFP